MRPFLAFELQVAIGLLFAGFLSCEGTDGTIVIIHDQAEAGAAAGGAPGSEPTQIPFVPAEDARWLARLDGAVDIDDDADFFYLDAEQQDPADLAELHRQGRHYLCYLSAGSYEDFRDDADQFPESAIGNPLAAFPSERWLDVRDSSVRELMARRIQTLAGRGCDGIPPSSLGVSEADTGFSLTREDALEYARWVAGQVHAAGMSVGLTGPTSLTADLAPDFDFGLAINCVRSTGCAEYEVLRTAEKPVLYVELGTPEAAPELCNAAKMLGLNAIVTDAGFNGTCVLCRDIL